jgi:hypothetical protein
MKDILQTINNIIKRESLPSTANHPCVSLQSGCKLLLSKRLNWAKSAITFAQKENSVFDPIKQIAIEKLAAV